ncbi:MAG TPA: UTP--glucose-1-phosphate uridylyltransferase, partial [Bryobacteraceae bacterium]|nr:UTP--glucose-1-phosphate uridylyltransferase [Bryobacteraceae bacterium]
MSELVGIISAEHRDPRRDRSLDSVCRGASLSQLLEECRALESFRRRSDNLYQRVRAQFFLYAIHRFHLPRVLDADDLGRIPFEATVNTLERRFEEAAAVLLRQPPSTAGSSALAAAYYGMAFQTLAAQVHTSVRNVRGNGWMSRIGHPADYPLSFRPELLSKSGAGLYPVLREQTPVRMDLTHSAWSDIFFLAMDSPEAARVLNVSVDLSVRGRGTPKPPVEASLRVIDEPVLRLTSVDLGASADITVLAEVFDFARDYLGLLKAAVIASGIVPHAMEGSPRPLTELLERLVGAGRGIEIVSRVRDIPKGSRLAVSTNLLACLIAICMRATRQIASLENGLTEEERRLVAARAILGEWLGGSGGGWQDSGGVWPAMKLIQGVEAQDGDPEWRVSRGRLLPQHRVLDAREYPVLDDLERSLVLVHGGMAQDVGPILEMVTEKYLLRSEAEWAGRKAALGFLDEILASLRNGDLRSVASATERNFFGPIQTIIPWASNHYTETLIRRVRSEFGDGFWGFWMLGGMSGGGMGFIFDPRLRLKGQDRLQTIMSETRQELGSAVPFAMEPVVYDFAVNSCGTHAELLRGESALMPAGYYDLVVPQVLRSDPRSVAPSRLAELNCFADACRRSPEFGGAVRNLFDRLLPDQTASPTAAASGSLEELLRDYGFDRVQHERIRSDLRSGRIGLAQNRLPTTATIEDAPPNTLLHAIAGDTGTRALRDGQVAVVTLAGGVGSRWTRGAGVVKALNPFARFNGRHRSFIEVHLAKSRRVTRLYETEVPHVFTTSYLTHDAIAQQLETNRHTLLSPGRSIGLRLVPMARDLRFLWEEMPHQILDEQKQKVRESLRAALIGWAQRAGEG